MGDEFFGENSRGGYGVIQTRYFSRLKYLTGKNKDDAPRESGVSRNFTLEGKNDFVSGCSNYDVFNTLCERCHPGLQFSNSTGECLKMANNTDNSNQPSSPLEPGYQNTIYLNPNLYQTDIS